MSLNCEQNMVIWETDHSCTSIFAPTERCPEVRQSYEEEGKLKEIGQIWKSHCTFQHHLSNTNHAARMTCINLFFVWNSQHLSSTEVGNDALQPGVSCLTISNLMLSLGHIVGPGNCYCAIRASELDIVKQR